MATHIPSAETQKPFLQEQRRAFRGPWGLSVWCLNGGLGESRKLQFVQNISLVSSFFPSYPCLDMFSIDSIVQYSSDIEFVTK